MKDFKKKLIPIIGISLASLTAIAATSTLAYFVINQNVDQNIYPNGGETKKSIFLDPNLDKWDRGYDELFYAYVWGYPDGSNPSSKAEYFLVPSIAVEIEMTINGDGVGSYKATRMLHIFEFDDLTFDHMIFTRMNPASVEQSAMSIGDSSWWNASMDASWCWGRTGDITYSSSYNYYRIDDYFDDSLYAKYSYGTIDRDGVVVIEGNNYTP